MILVSGLAWSTFGGLRAPPPMNRPCYCLFFSVGTEISSVTRLRFCSFVDSLRMTTGSTRRRRMKRVTKLLELLREQLHRTPRVVTTRDRGRSMASICRTIVVGCN